jgi:hypothetical protein
MSTKGAAAIGEAYQQICALHCDKILSNVECQRAMGRLKKHARSHGYTLSHLNARGEHMVGAMSVSWMGYRGHSHRRIYERFGTGAAK